MIKRLFSSTSKTITGAAIILGLASFLSRLVGVIRDRILAHYFGAGDILDAYYVAFRIPDLLFNLLIAGALSAGFIPIFLKVWNKNKKEAWRLTSNVLNFVLLSFIIVCGILYVFMPHIMPVIAPGFAGEKLELATRLSRIMLLSPILLGISSVVSSVLHAVKNFLVFAISPILYNIGIIMGVVFFVPKFGPIGLAYGVIVGALMHVSIQLPALFHQGFTYQPLFNWKDKNLREVGKLIIPRTLGLATHQINLLVITIIASTLAAGSVTIFNFANNLQYFPIGLIGHSFAIAAFPTFALLIAQNKKTKMIEHLSRTIRQIVFLIVPATIIFLLLRGQIVRVVLGTGEFDWAATTLTANTLAFFVLSLFAQALILLLARAFYAIHDTWTPFFASVLAVLINLFGALYLKDTMGILGLAFSFSISMVVQLAVMWLLLRRKLGSLGEAKMLSSLYKISIAALIMAGVLQYTKAPLASMVDMTRFWGIFTQGFIAASIGFGFYLASCHIMRVEEFELFKKSFKRRFLKITDVKDEIVEPSEV